MAQYIVANKHRHSAFHATIYTATFYGIYGACANTKKMDKGQYVTLLYNTPYHPPHGIYSGIFRELMYEILTLLPHDSHPREVRRLL